MNSIQLNHIGTIKLSGAEISDFDPISQRLFVTGESGNKPVLQVVDVSDANNPTQVTNIDLSSLGAGIQSVAVRKGIGTGNSIVAIAISATTSTDPGKIAFYDAVTLTKISEVTVGALPDMITFTADGSKLLVTNEGEPSENYAIDPEGSISIIDVSGNIASLDNSKVTTANFTAFNGQKETLKAAGVRLFGLNATVAQDLEPEYIAVSPDGKTAFITLQENNAFAVLDIATANITKIVPLGFKDHNLPGNGLDASDRDVNGTSSGGGKINIQNWPIFGMYQPDAISSFQIADKTYYITANEGDARIRPTADGTFGNEGSLFNEEARVSSLNLDPTAFPNATELKKPENLGRLTVTNKLGDTDGDGDFDQLYAYGARSFSIWDDQGKLVYDSGDQIEQILKQQTPTFFNANNGSATEFDTRSDNKGPEPESVIVGVIDDVPYGFVGLERAGGGVMVYNLSNPTAPEFIQYIRTEGDISPEGLKFISAADSPNAKPMLAVANEVSNTVSFYEIASPPKLTTYEFQNLPKLGTTSTGQDIFLGGFSGLYFQGVADNGNLKFVTNTDRGPNGEPTGQNRPFLLPNFQPEIVSFELNQPTNQITITKRTGLFREDGTTPLTGLPNVQAGAGGTAYTDEIGVDLNGQILPNDTLGADVEGIVIAPNGNYWLVDEYRPAIYHFDVNGKLLDRFVPQGTAAATEPDQPAGTFGTEVLPAVYAQRRANRGFEAIALEGNKLYAFIQSPIDNPDNGTDTTSRNSRNLRILEFDIVSKQVTGEYLYLLDDITGSGNAKTDKIGDAVALGNGKFAVVERDDRSDNTSNKLIYQIDLAAATNINNPANFTLPSGKTIEQLSPAELTTAGIIAANKTLIVNAAQIGYTGVEKLEGLALVAPNILAVINDNDFNVAGTTIPEKLGIIELPDYLPITISGTSGNDSLTAFTSGYTVLGLAGNDYISAVETGRGGNILDGGAGDDEIFAKENDTALGGSGNDQIFSDGQGNNILSGGEGNDQIFPDRNDKVFGDTGNDIIFSGLGGNTLTGGDGQDTFWLANAAYLQSPNIITDFNPAQDLLNVNVDGFKDINQLTLSPQGDYTLISANSNPLAILKNYELPQFAITSASATEGNIIIFTVTRTGNNSSSQSVTVTTSIATGDTASDTDLTAKTATLTFAPGETTTTFAVQTTPDVLFEGNETFTVSLSNPTNVSIISSTNATAQGTITNDDAAPIFSIATAEASEGNAINFTVTRTGDAQAQQSVTVVTSIATGDTASDTDLTAKTETLTFAQGETTKIFAVQTTPDVLFEDQETFTASLSNATNGAIISSTNATAKGTINNDDAAPIFSIAAAQALEGSAINFTLTRTGDAQANQTVTVSTSIEAQNTATASDFSGNTQTLTFAQGETTKTFTVATIQDSLVEDNETFTVSLSSPTNGAIISSTNGIALGTITDDDTPAEFRISAAEALEGNAINFTVTRSRDNLIAQSVTVATSIATDDTASANDLTAKTETLTFATGETSKTFTVQTTQDSLFEGNETFTVSLSNPNNGAVVSSTNGTAKGTINNDDAAPIFSIAAASATEGSAVNFTVTRTGDAQSNQSVTVATSIATDDTASANDLTANTQTLTFATGETSKTFTVQTTQDSLFEGNETFTVSLSNPNNGAVVSSTNGTAKGTINNDDAAPIFSIAAASATEGSAVNFTVTRTGDAQSNQNVTIATSIGIGDTASGSDFTTKTETLTFAQGEASKTFTVQTTQDALLEVNETFTVSLSNPTNGAIISSTSGTAKGTIEDSIIKITANTQDGPIVGANVFFDGNFNGIKDGDEPQTTTDSTGNFTLEIIGSYDLNKNGRLDPTEGYYVATGGKDAITGLPFTGNLRAVAGSTVVTPITTLVSSIVDTGVSLEKASTQVKTALGIPDSVDLGTFNPIATENLGSSEAQKVLTAQVGVQAFIGQITTAFASVTNIDRITLGNQVTSNLATAVQSTNFNLSDVNQVKSLITNTVNSLKVLDNNLDLAKITTNTEQISQIVSANSQQILTATSISTVFKAQKVAQSDTTQDITAALKGEKSFQDVVARNTGEALKELIAQATIETLVNLEVTPITVTEDGISNLVYTFTRIGDTANTLTVNYDITGTANSSDYTGAIPGTGKTITFAAGSSKATLTVDPTPDTIIENDETVVLTLATGTGYTVGTSTAVTGTISNINKPPIITSGITFSVLDNTTTVGTVTATDPENQSLTYNLIGGVDQNLFTINATTGALRFKTAPDFKAPSDVGKDNVYDIKVQVTDGSNLVTQDIAIRVVTGMPAPINQAPTNITLQNSITTLSEGTSTTTRLKVADIVITDDGLGSNTISLTGVDAASFEVEGTVLYIKKDTKLDYETKNSYGVTVNVDDTTVGNTPDVFTNFTLTVTDVNYAPEVKPNQIFSYTENKTANFQVGTVLATDDIAVTGFAIASGNDSGFFNINNQGIITLTDKGVTSAANDFERSPNSFTLGIIAKDAAEATSQVTNVTINVTNDPTDDNKKPNLQSFTQNGQEDQIISFGIGDFKDKGKYQDEDNNDLMAIKVISLPTAGSLTFVNGQQVTVNQEILVNDLANVRYNPVVNANGNVATFTVAAIDNGTPKAESDPATITINLTPVNDPPVAQNDQLSVSQGSAGTINPLNNDSDPEGDSLKLTGKTDGKYGKVDINGNNLTYTLLDANYLGNDVFSYTVSDGDLSASANVRVTVTGKAATDTVAPTQLIPIAPDDKLIPREAGTLTGIVDTLGYKFPNNYNPSLVKNSLQNALNRTTAAFNNLFGLYEVDDVTGSVNGIKPGETGYAKAALSKVVDNFIVRVGGSSSGAASDVVVSGGKIYSPFVIANGGNFSGNLQQAINAFFAANPNNSPATAQNYTTLPVAYFSFGVANPDGAAHLRSFGNNTFGFEDLPAGVGVSDYDFNDAVFSFGAIA